MILAGDVGGTKVHLALYDFINGKLEYNRDERYPAKNYSGLQEIVKEFLGASQASAACFGVPGPVRDGRLRLTNLPWTLDSRELAASLGIQHVFLINDLEANGYGIAELSDGQVYTLSEGDELFLPTHMTYDFDIDAPRRGGTQGALGLAGYSAWAHSSWAVGVGRRMLDELVKVIVPRRDPFGPSAESASFKFQFAQAEAKYRAARALVHETWRDVSDTCSRGETPSLDQMTMIKLSLRHIHDVISDVGTFAHRAARGASLHNTPMQRFYRDIHAGTQHILMADQIVEECGRALLGLPGPTAQWTVFGVNG